MIEQGCQQRVYGSLTSLFFLCRYFTLCLRWCTKILFQGQVQRTKFLRGLMFSLLNFPLFLTLGDLGVPLSRLTSTTIVSYQGNTEKIQLKVPNLGGANNLAYRV